MSRLLGTCKNRGISILHFTQVIGGFYKFPAKGSHVHESIAFHFSILLSSVLASKRRKKVYLIH